MTVSERDKLVEDNLNLVWWTMRRYYPAVFGREDEEDIFQIGCLGLVDAATKYQGREDIQFSTFAVVSIRSAISHEFRFRNRQKNTKMQSVSFEYSPDDDDSSLSETIPDDRYRPDQQWFDDFETFEKTLTPRQKDIFRSMVEEKTVYEIAEECNCSRQSIQQKMQRIRMLFAKFYDIPGYEEVEVKKRGRPRKENSNAKN